MSKTPFKMNGWSGYQSSPLKDNMSKEEILELIKNDSWQGKDFSIGEKARSSELLMQSSGALTSNPLPSMPSISNVGAAPFSGSINWNAIPGGFQPLPQIAGGKKKLYQLSQFHGGINKKSSPTTKKSPAKNMKTGKYAHKFEKKNKSKY